VTSLRQRMLEDLQIRHYTPTTIRIYLHVIAEFARHFGKPPDQFDAERRDRDRAGLACWNGYEWASQVVRGHVF
jgi:hypothetical protein